MKRFFYIALAVILGIIVSLIAYGAYLNYTGEKNISDLVSKKRYSVWGSVVKKRKINQELLETSVDLRAKNVTEGKALIDGRIVEFFVKKNDEVQEGQPIFRMVDDTLSAKISAAESNIMKTKAEMAKAGNSYERYSRLLEMDATSLEKYEESKMLYEGAQAAYQDALAQREQLAVIEDRQLVRAPTAGTVLLVYQNAGSVVSAGTPVVLIGDFHKLYATITLDDAVSRYLKQGEMVEIFFIGLDSTKVYGTKYEKDNRGTRSIFPARIVAITPPPEENGDKRVVEVEIDNSRGTLEEKTYMYMRLRTNIVRECLTVSRKAFYADDYDQVYLVDDEGIIRERKVTIGTGNYDYVEVLSGLTEGDIVAMGRSSVLRIGTKANVMVEGDDD